MSRLFRGLEKTAKTNPEVIPLITAVCGALLVGGAVAIHTLRTNPEIVVNKNNQRPFLSHERYSSPHDSKEQPTH